MSILNINTCTNSRVIRFAQTELRRYLSKVSNSQDSPTTVQFEFINDVKFCPQNLYDGFGLKWYDNALTISAIKERAFVNAIYWILKKLGFTFPFPGMEHIPQMADWDTLKDAIQQTPWQIPSFNHRILHFDNMRLNAAAIDWAGKLLINMIQENKHVYLNDIAADSKLLEMIKDRGIELNVGCHGFDNWLPPKTYGAKHPEWYAASHSVNKGNITEPDDNKLPITFTTGQLCLSNKEMIRTFADNVIQFAKTHPEVSIISFWPNDVGDGGGWCNCENCLSLEPDPKRIDLQSKLPSRSASYLWFINQLAPLIMKEIPNVRIEFAAFYEFSSPPVSKAMIPDGDHFLGCLVCDYFGCLLHGHGSQCNRGRLRNDHCQWRSLFKGEIYGFGYYADLCKFMDFPMVLTSKIKDDFVYLKDISIDSVQTIVVCASFEYNLQKMFPNIYSFASLSWNHTQSDELVIKTLAQEIAPQSPDSVFYYLKEWNDIGVRHPDKHAGWIWLEPEQLNDVATSRCQFLTIRDVFEESDYRRLQSRMDQLQSQNFTCETTAKIIKQMVKAFETFKKLYAYDPCKPVAVQQHLLEKIRDEVEKRGPFPAGIIPLLNRLSKDGKKILTRNG